jgi:hypothetical protein
MGQEVKGKINLFILTLCSGRVFFELIASDFLEIIYELKMRLCHMAQLLWRSISEEWQVGFESVWGSSDPRRCDGGTQ